MEIISRCVLTTYILFNCWGFPCGCVQIGTMLLLYELFFLDEAYSSRIWCKCSDRAYNVNACDNKQEFHCNAQGRYYGLYIYLMYWCLLKTWEVPSYLWLWLFFDHLLNKKVPWNLYSCQQPLSCCGIFIYYLFHESLHSMFHLINLSRLFSEILHIKDVPDAFRNTLFVNWCFLAFCRWTL